MVLMAGSHNSLAFKSLQIGEEEEEKMALTERALLAAEAVIAEDESTSTTNLKTASVNTLLLECEESSDSHPEVVQVWQPCSTQPGRRSSCKSHSSGKLCNYLKRHYVCWLGSSSPSSHYTRCENYSGSVERHWHCFPPTNVPPTIKLIMVGALIYRD
jgi:hypothetical protein